MWSTWGRPCRRPLWWGGIEWGGFGLGILCSRRERDVIRRGSGPYSFPFLFPTKPTILWSIKLNFLFSLSSPLSASRNKIGRIPAHTLLTYFDDISKKIIWLFSLLCVIWFCGKVAVLYSNFRGGAKIRPCFPTQTHETDNLKEQFAINWRGIFQYLSREIGGLLRHWLWMGGGGRSR